MHMVGEVVQGRVYWAGEWPAIDCRIMEDRFHRGRQALMKPRQGRLSLPGTHGYSPYWVLSLSTFIIDLSVEKSQEAV